MKSLLFWRKNKREQLIKNWFEDDYCRVSRDAIYDKYYEMITYIQVYPWEEYINKQGCVVKSKEMRKTEGKWFISYDIFELNNLTQLNFYDIAKQIFKDCIKKDWKQTLKKVFLLPRDLSDDEKTEVNILRKDKNE